MICISLCRHLVHVLIEIDVLVVAAGDAAVAKCQSIFLASHCGLLGVSIIDNTA